MFRRPLPKISIKLFKKGAEVMYQGWPYRVDHVNVNARGLLVSLEGLEKPVPSHLLEIEPTEIDFEEQRQLRDRQLQQGYV